MTAHSFLPEDKQVNESSSQTVRITVDTTTYLSIVPDH